MRFNIVYYLMIVLLVLPFNGNAQPEPCDPENPEMTSNCIDACVICDIDGFTGRHSSDLVGQAPPGFAGECTNIAHNMQWIAFVAGSENLKIQLSVSNCQMGLGLEFGLYKGENCQNLTRISNCFGGFNSVSPGTSGTIENLESLVVGQYYFIVMDGALGDNCDWTFSVLDGSTELTPLNDSDLLSGPTTACLNEDLVYEAEVELGSTLFTWSVDGIEQSTGNESMFETSFSIPGTHEICVVAANVCNEGPLNCFTTFVKANNPTQVNDVFCEGDCYQIEDTTICDPGTYAFTLIDQDGCDSTFNLALNMLPLSQELLDLEICDGDSIFIGNTPFFESGNYESSLVTSNECDSTVFLDLFVIICNIQSNHFSESVACFGESNGSISFEIINGTPPFSYTWEQLGGNLNGVGNISNLGNFILLDNLSTGTYIITTEDNFDNKNIILAEVNQPNPLEVELEVFDRNGFALSCFDSEDGIIEAIPNGGNPNYQYDWSTGFSSAVIENIPANNYSVTLTDMEGCSVSASTNLSTPPAIFINATSSDPNCDGLQTGMLTFENTIGGAGGFSYKYNDQAFSSNNQFTQLSPGEYQIEVMDQNGCLADTMITLGQADIPIISLPEDFELNLGDSTQIRVQRNMSNIQSIDWQATDQLNLIDSLAPFIRPYNNATYQLSVTSIDGCTASDSISVTVNKFRTIFPPNVFSPNQDGVNDHFSLLGGSEVRLIQSLQVYNRWGALIYHGKELPAADPTQGWNGRFKEEPVENGVYLWLAQVEFIDGVVLSYSGDVLVLR